MSDWLAGSPGRYPGDSMNSMARIWWQPMSWVTSVKSWLSEHDPTCFWFFVSSTRICESSRNCFWSHGIFQFAGAVLGGLEGSMESMSLSSAMIWRTAEQKFWGVVASGAKEWGVFSDPAGSFGTAGYQVPVPHSKPVLLWAVAWDLDRRMRPFCWNSGTFFGTSCPRTKWLAHHGRGEDGARSGEISHKFAEICWRWGLEGLGGHDERDSWSDTKEVTQAVEVF